MKYFQHVNLPDWKIVTDKALNYYYEHRAEYFAKYGLEKTSFAFSKTDPLDIFEKIPEINTMLSTFNTTGIDVWFFEFGKYQHADDLIHMDNSPYDARLLLPLLNCDNTETRYYVSSEEPMLMADIKIAVPGTCTQVAEFCLDDGPVVMRPNEFHSVHVPENHKYPRISMLLMTEDDLTYILE